jgi:hypothetical protein
MKEVTFIAVKSFISSNEENNEKSVHKSNLSVHNRGRGGGGWGESQVPDCLFG